MCGIFARIERATKPESSVPEVRHRGPDAAGCEVMAMAGFRVTLAHWRLSIIDPQPASNQPFWLKPGGPVIVFNGEIYNYRELRGRIGGDFRTASDTEVLLAAYEKWGPDCLGRLRGMFAFVIADPQRKKIFAARDRFGIKPLYFRRDGDTWEFASEIKQLLRPSPRINEARARDYLLFGAQDHTDETLFEGILQLRGGECVEIPCEHPGEVKSRRWYDSPSSPRFRGDYEDATRLFREKFFDTMQMHLRSDVPLGFCLSGGMDSSALLCAAGALLQNSGGERTAINCRYPIQGMDESGFAQAAAAMAGARLIQTSPDSASLATDLEKVTYFQDEPLNNASIFSQYRVFEEARAQGLKVMMDGQGGDEMLASYPQFFGPYLLGLFRQGRLPTLFEEADFFWRDHRWGWSDTLKSMALWFAPRPVFRLAKSLASPWKSHPWIQRDFYSAQGTPLPPWQSPARMENGATTNAMSLLMIRQLTLPMLLHWEDRNSMAHGIESRVPFLDHELLELALSLPDEFKIRKGVTKRILKSALRDIMPPEIVARRDKLGFTTPEELWMRENRGNFFGELIASAASDFPSIFNGPGLAKMWQSFREGAPYRQIFWRIATFVIWGRVFGVKE